MANQLVTVTGVAQVDAILRTLEPKLQKKFTRQALRKGMKRVVSEFKRIVQVEAYDTGAYMRSASVRAMKRQRTRVGMQMHIDSKKLAAERLKKTGQTGLRKKSDIVAVHADQISNMYYYPASLEFGYTRKDGKEVPAIRPQRRALYDNEDTIRRYFIEDIRELIAEAAVKGTA